MEVDDFAELTDVRVKKGSHIQKICMYALQIQKKKKDLKKRLGASCISQGFKPWEEILLKVSISNCSFWNLPPTPSSSI